MSDRGFRELGKSYLDKIVRWDVSVQTLVSTTGQVQGLRQFQKSPTHNKVSIQVIMGRVDVQNFVNYIQETDEMFLHIIYWNFTCKTCTIFYFSYH